MAAGGPADPIVVSTDRHTTLAYRIAEGWNPDDLATRGGIERIAVCSFRLVRGVYFGSPNDEALENHPLYDRGLGYYGVFRVEASSWARTLQHLGTKKGSALASREREPFRHWIVTMEDRTFECVADDCRFEIRTGPMADVAAALLSPLVSD